MADSLEEVRAAGQELGIQVVSGQDGKDLEKDACRKQRRLHNHLQWHL
jgi:hypothetical protein